MMLGTAAVGFGGGLFRMLNSDPEKGARTFAKQLYNQGHKPGIRKIDGETYVLLDDDLVRHEMNEISDGFVKQNALGICVGTQDFPAPRKHRQSS